MVGNLKKTVIFFKFPTVFLRKKKEKVRVGEGKKLPSPCLVLILVDKAPFHTTFINYSTFIK